VKPSILFALAALVLVPPLAGSQEGGETSEQQMMELWRKWAMTDEHHKQLAWYVGKWDTEMNVVGMGTTKGTAEFKWIIDGRWLAETREGTMMGQPLQGYGIIGYDRFKKKWVATKVSSMDTAMLRFEGTVVDPTGKVMVLWCNLDEYLTGEHDKMAKAVYRRIDDTKFVLEVWDMAMGPEGGRAFDITYTRSK
jgi:hypothetical protein